MSGLREVREALLLMHSENYLNDEEFLLLYDINKSKNPDFPYWNYTNFDLDQLNEDECIANFRFKKNDILLLKHLMQIPNDVICYNRTKTDGLEALCIFLRRFAYPVRYGDMIPAFGRSVPELSMISNKILNHIHKNFNRLLGGFNHGWMTPESLEEYARVVHQKGAALDFCWGFIDGTVRPICRPGQNQRVLYNGHKRVHSIKFQSVVISQIICSQSKNMFRNYVNSIHDIFKKTLSKTKIVKIFIEFVVRELKKKDIIVYYLFNFCFLIPNIFCNVIKVVNILISNNKQQLFIR